MKLRAICAAAAIFILAGCKKHERAWYDCVTGYPTGHKEKPCAFPTSMRIEIRGAGKDGTTLVCKLQGNILSDCYSQD